MKVSGDGIPFPVDEQNCGNYRQHFPPTIQFGSSTKPHFTVYQSVFSPLYKFSLRDVERLIQGVLESL